VGVKNLKGICFPRSSEYLEEKGSPRFTDNATLKVTDYNNAVKTIAFVENLPPSSGGPTFQVKRFTSNVNSNKIDFVHNLGNAQVQVSIQQDNNGTPGEFVWATHYPSISDPLNILTVEVLNPEILHVTIVG